MIRVLSLEYETLREEILVRTSGRYQFLALMTTAAALLASGFGRSIFSDQAWISSFLALLVFAAGLTYYWRLGHHIVMVSRHIANLEARINALVHVRPGTAEPLSWETRHQHRGRWQRISLGLVVGRNRNVR